MAYRDPWAHLVTYRLLQSIPFENLLTNEEVASCLINDYLLPALDVSVQIHFFSDFFTIYICCLVKEDF